MDDAFDWDFERTVAELRVRYGALRHSTTAECMTMLLAAASQLAHRDESHPAAVLYVTADQVKMLWGTRWGTFIHEMLETDVE